MSKTFRPWKIDEPLLLPPLVQDFVAKDHLARLVLELVRAKAEQDAKFDGVFVTPSISRCSANASMRRRFSQQINQLSIGTVEDESNFIADHQS
jgi:hypothetical protein